MSNNNKSRSSSVGGNVYVSVDMPFRDSVSLLQLDDPLLFIHISRHSDSLAGSGIAPARKRDTG